MVRSTLGRGALSGLIGSIALVLMFVAFALATGVDPWLALKITGAPVMGHRGLVTGPDAARVLFGFVSPSSSLPFGEASSDSSSTGSREA